MKPVLSYVMTTYNKLPYLKQVAKRLIANKKADEEIIIADGGSKDGTVEFLKELHEQGHIAAWVSAPDAGESHGTNRGVLMSSGEIIKIVTDDDAFSFDNIARCRKFMLDNSELDLMGTDGASVYWSRAEPFGRSNYKKHYDLWKRNHKPFGFCGLGWFIRRSSLPLLGLFNTNYIRMDAEYSLRATAGKAKLGWFTGPTWVRIVNPLSGAVTKKHKIAEETKKLNQLYGIEVDDMTFTLKVKSYFHPVKRYIKSVSRKFGPIPVPRYTPDPETAFKICDEWILTANAKEHGEFLKP